MVAPLLHRLLPLLLVLLPGPAHSAAAAAITVERNGTLYALNAGLCEAHACGADERRGACRPEIYRGRPAHYCQCNLPFTGAFCASTIRLNASLPSSVYAECALPLYCAAVYGDGRCNEECNSPECLYDGYECVRAAACPREEYCRERFGNGLCDDACAREECEYDGGDCFGELDTLPGQLLLRLSMSAQDFMRLSHLFLFQLSRFLRATVVLSQDARGPLVWAWEGAGRGARIAKGENSSIGIEVAFSIDLTRCSTECLDSVSRVVEFINQALASKSLPMASALSSVVAVSSSSPSDLLPPSTLSLHATLLLTIGGLCLLLTVLIGMTMRQAATNKRKRTLDAPVWYPPVIGGVASPAAKRKRARRAPSATPLHLAAAADGDEPLPITGADEVNARDERGRTPLLVAVASQRREAALREALVQLVEAGADVNVVDEDGWGALHHALHKLRSPAFVRWLLGRGACPLQVDAKGRSLIHLAVEYDDVGNLEVLLETDARKMINEADAANRLPLSMAVADCSLAMARKLLEHGAGVNLNGDETFDPAIVRKFPLHHAVQYNNKDHAKLLINRGARMDAQDSRQRTALHYAVLYADLAMARLLVDAGTPVDTVDDEERTAEDIAADWNMVETRAYLVNVRGANAPYRRKRGVAKPKQKRYSSDQGYGSEESQRCSPDDMMKTPEQLRSEAATPPLPALYLSPRKSFGIPKWGAGAQLPLFHTTPLTPLTKMAHHFPTNNYPSVLTPSNKLLGASTDSLMMSPPFLGSSTYALTPL